MLLRLLPEHITTNIYFLITNIKSAFLIVTFVYFRDGVRCLIVCQCDDELTTVCRVCDTGWTSRFLC